MGRTVCTVSIARGHTCMLWSGGGGGGGWDQIKKTVANNAHLKQVSYVHVLEQHAELFAVTWAQIMQPICL